MSKVLLAVSERWIADARVDAIADFVKRLGDRCCAACGVWVGGERDRGAAGGKGVGEGGGAVAEGGGGGGDADVV